MNLVLNKEVYHRGDSAEECSSDILSIFDCFRVWRTQCDTTSGPWNGSYEVGNHEDIVPVMIVGRSDVRPTPTCKSPEDTHTSDELGESLSGLCRQKIPESDEGESRT